MRRPIPILVPTILVLAATAGCAATGTPRDAVPAVPAPPAAPTAAPAAAPSHAAARHLDPDVEAALALAGANRGELERFLARFEGGADAEKAAAARFLVANMQGRGYVVFGWKGAKGEKVAFDALSYPDFKAASAAFDALEKEHGTIDYVRDRFVPDVETVRADFLADHLDRAFAAWRAVPEAERASFDVFLDFILPYRGSEEPVEDWLGPIQDRLAALRASLPSGASRADLRAAAEKDVSKRLRFDEVYYLHPTDQGFSEMERSGMGRCEDLSNMQTFWSRAQAFPTACDYTPAWAHRDNNHAWTVDLDAAGRGHDGAGARAAKVYRKTWRIRRDALAFQLPEGRAPANRWLGSKTNVDVTDQYGPTTDVTVTVGAGIDGGAAHGERVAYLCVFNGGEWIAIHWGRIADGRVTFTKMGRDILYLPAVHDGKALVPVAPPLVVRKDGTVESLAGRGERTAVSLVATTPGQRSPDTGETTPLSHLKTGARYALSVWDGAWKPDGTPFEAGKIAPFVSLVPDALHWLVEEGSHRLERPFTVEDGRQRFW